MKTTWRNGNNIELLVNGDEFYPSVFEGITHARTRVILETFTWSEDKVGYALRDVLISAVQRGIRVDATVDGFGSIDLSPDFLAPMVDAGVNFHFYDPRPRLFGILPTNVFRRMHRKLIVVDGIVAWIGGINFSADHLSDYGAEAKQDYAVRVTGPVVDDIFRFALTALANDQESVPWWKRNFFRRVPMPSTGNAMALFIWRDNGSHRRDIERQYLLMLRKSQHEVIIANAYFFPSYRLLRAICKAARRNVSVRLIIQGQPDIPVVLTGARLLYPWLIKAGVSIYEYCRQPVHAKVAVQDDCWATIGSSNLDPFSMELNLEANLVINDRNFNQTLRTNLYELIDKDCVKVDSTLLPKHTYWQAIKGIMVFHLLKRFPSFAAVIPTGVSRLTRVHRSSTSGKSKNK